MAIDEEKAKKFLEKHKDKSVSELYGLLAEKILELRRKQSTNEGSANENSG